jgi:predicted DNA-binding antitoxin AbrB/MazE fold protein
VGAIVEAVYEGGVFKPAARPALAEGAHVRLTVEIVGTSTPEDILRLALGVYDGLSPGEIDDVERLTRRRPLFDDRRA